MMQLGMEGGPCDGSSAAVKVDEHGRPPETLTVGTAEYVLRWHGIAPHAEANWHYCYKAPQPQE